MSARPSISLVIPSYNEEANIRATVARCLENLKKFTDQPEIVIVDDCSTDSMPQIAAEMARTMPALKVVRNPINLGAGMSLLVGIYAAKGEIICHDSMDYPFDVADLEFILPKFAEADAVAIVRKDRAAHSPWRKLTSFTHHWMVRVLFRFHVRDMNFVQAYRREIFQRIRVRAKSPAFVTPEILIRAHDAGFRIAQVEAVFHPREKGVASYGRPRDILWTFADMISFWLERGKERKLAKKAAHGQS